MQNRLSFVLDQDDRFGPERLVPKTPILPLHRFLRISFVFCLLSRLLGEGFETLEISTETPPSAVRACDCELHRRECYGFQVPIPKVLTFFFPAPIIFAEIEYFGLDGDSGVTD